MFTSPIDPVLSSVCDLTETLYPLLSSRDQDLLTPYETKLIECCWRMGVASYFHAVWRWRVYHIDPLNDVGLSHHSARLKGRLWHGYDSAHLHLNSGQHRVHMLGAARIVRRALSHSWHPTRTLTQQVGNGTYLVFFDGGSRVAPGPGGSGAAIVELGPTVAPVRVWWVSGMSYSATTTTNNYAETMELLSGLPMCIRRQWSPLHIVDDSALIIQQHEQRKAPIAAHLRLVFW
ncbi:hypothetical protein PC116_g3877 [Phytophthora cactorum]|nr:hypothetical protein PC114_g3242 [Phytophthora cactorum]KAG4248394.1 hypothetical protein PC116_g3877 [Phytophthora cactorum]